MPQEELTQSQIFSLLLAAVTRTEAKVDLLLHGEARKRAEENGTTVEEEAAKLDDIIGQHAEKQGDTKYSPIKAIYRLLATKSPASYRWDFLL